MGIKHPKGVLGEGRIQTEPCNQRTYEFREQFDFWAKPAVRELCIYCTVLEGGRFPATWLIGSYQIPPYMHHFHPFAQPYQ